MFTEVCNMGRRVQFSRGCQERPAAITAAPRWMIL